MIRNEKAQKARHLLTRLAIALVFITFGIWELTNPKYWEGFLPRFLPAAISPTTIILLHGALLLIIGIAILTGFYLKAFSALAAIMLFLIILALLYLTGFIQIVVRDSAILLVTCSLFLDDTRYLCITGKK